MRFKEIIQKCDAIVLPAYIAGEEDIDRINHLQSINKDFNKLFKKTIICVNYKSLEIREEYKDKIEELFNNHFNSVDYIHNKTNFTNVRSLCEQEESLIQLCKSRNYKFICKTMDHVVILKEAYDLELNNDSDFYYTNGIGAQRCLEWENDIELIANQTFFPQTNFYFLDVSKIDYIYNLEDVKQKHLDYEENDKKIKLIDPEYKFHPKLNGYFVCCEDETGKMATRNKLKMSDMIPKDKFKLLIQRVIYNSIVDPSFKNLSTCGILHYQYINQPINKLI